MIKMRILDLSMPISKETPAYPGDPTVEIKLWTSIERDGYYMNALSLGEHSGTHVDAPAHFIERGATVEEVPLERFMGEALVIDISSKAGITANTLERDLKGKIVLLYTGCSEKKSNHPGLSKEEAKLLVELGVKAVGIDAPSIDHDFEAHRILLSAGVPIFENLTNLEKLIGKKFLFIGFPLKIAGGSGSPVRAVAVLED